MAPLESKAGEGESALGRLHALCTLDGLGALKPEHVRRSLTDHHPGVRLHAVRLSETPAAQAPEVENALVKCVSDPDPSVRLQLAESLRSCQGAECGRALGKLLRENAGDPYISAAALSSLTRKNVVDVVEAVLAGHEDLPTELMQGLLQSSVGFGEPTAIVSLLGRLVEPRDGRHGTGQFAALAAWLDSLDQRNTPLGQLVQQADPSVRATLRRLGAVFKAAREAVGDPTKPLTERVQAAHLLGRGLDGGREDRAALAELLAPQSAEELQSAAVDTLARLHDPRVLETLLSGWKGYTPKLRSRVLDVLLQRVDGPRALLDALRVERILPQDVPLTSRQRLLEHPSLDIRERAGKLFTDRVDPDRNKVVLALQPALRLVGEPRRGLQVFTKTCASCHRLGGVGQAVGPDLAMVRDKLPEWILAAVFDPSRAVDARFLHYSAVTREGKVFTGVLAEEGGNSITLVGPSGGAQVILRANLEELTSTGKSAMPEGLEKELKPQDVADLIAYLRKPGPPKPVVDPRSP